MMSSLSDKPGKLTVYCTGWCPDCHRVRYFLNEYGVDYTEIDVDEDAAGREFVRRVNGGRVVVPTAVFADGSIHVEPPNTVLAAKLNLSETW